MKILKNTIIITFIISGLIFARTTTGKGVKRAENKNLIVKNHHFLIKDHANEDKGQLDRKRSNKRRRKIRKPIKGLR